YHLIPLAHELRALGVTARIGFFLHVPLPPPEILCSLPGHRELLATLADYDLIGVQTDTDLRALQNYFSDSFHATPAGGGRIVLPDATHFIGAAFPVGVDPDGIAANATLALTSNAHVNLVASLRGRALAISVD